MVLYYDDYIAPACAELFHYIWLQCFLLAVSISFLSRRALVYMYGTQENKGKTGFYAVSGPHRSRRDSSNFIRPMSIEEAHDPDEIDYTKARKGPQIQAALSASFGGLMIGCNNGWSSPVQPQLQFSNATNSSYGVIEDIWNIQLTPDEMSWASSIVNIGALFGSLCGGLLMDKFGRRTVLMAMTAPYLVEWLLITLAVHPSMLCIGRLIGGLAVGICSAAVPTYIGEISTPNMRGTLGTLFATSVCVGMLLSSVLAWLNWRWISCILGLQSVWLILGMFVAPESPYYLVKKGELFYAQNSLLWLRGPRYNVAAELKQIEARVEDDRQQITRVKDLFSLWVVKPLSIALAMMFFQQMTGYNANFFYLIEIFRLSGSTLDPKFCAIIYMSVSVSATLISSIFIMDRFRRRTVFITSESFLCLSTFTLGAYFYVLDHYRESAELLGWFPLVILITFEASVSMGIGPLIWVVSNEILPDRLKGPGSSIAAFFHWLLAFIVTKTFVDLQRDLTTAGTFWFYGCFSFFGIIYGLYLMPETGGMTSDEIQALLYLP